MNFRNKICWLLLFWWCCGCLPMVAQNDLGKLLERLEAHPQRDTGRMEILRDVTWQVVQYNSQGVLDCANEIIDIAKEIDDTEWLAEGIKLLGVYYWYDGDNDRALATFEEALELGKQTGNAQLIASCSNNVGLVYSRKCEFFKAYQAHQFAYNHAREHGLFDTWIVAGSNMAEDLYRNRNYDRALEINLELDTYIDANSQTLKRVKRLKTIVAIETLKCYAVLKDTVKANLYFQKAFDLAKETKNMLILSKCYLYKGKLYMESGNIPAAEKYLSIALEEADRGHFIDERTEILIANARLFYLKEEWGKALAYAQKSLQLGLEAQNLSIQSEIYEQLSLITASLEDYESAYQYGKSYRLLHDSLNLICSNSTINELDYNHKMEEKEAKKQLLLAEQKNNQAAIRQSTVGAIAVLSVLLMMLTFAYYLFISKKSTDTTYITLDKIVQERTRNMEEANRQLLTKNEELERFAYIASHDLKEPLRNVNTYIKLIERKTKGALGAEVREYFDFIVSNTVQMQQLVHDVLFFTKVGKIDKVIKHTDLNQFVQNLTDYELMELMRTKHGAISHHHLPTIDTCPDLLKIALKHLIKNGLVFNESYEPEVQISYRETDGYHQLVVSDNGIGIEPQYHGKIFEMFKRLHPLDVYKSSGIGLAVCKKIVTMLDGTIEVASTLGEGSTFTLSIPVVSGKVAVAVEASVTGGGFVNGVIQEVS